MMQHEEFADIASREFPRQLDIAQVSVYSLSILSAAMF